MRLTATGEADPVMMSNLISTVKATGPLVAAALLAGGCAAPRTTAEMLPVVDTLALQADYWKLGTCLRETYEKRFPWRPGDNDPLGGGLHDFSTKSYEIGVMLRRNAILNVMVKSTGENKSAVTIKRTTTQIWGFSPINLDAAADARTCATAAS
jgi:hypothetical protein